MDSQSAGETTSVPSTLDTEQAAAGVALPPEPSGSRRSSETSGSQLSISKLKENFDQLETRLAALEEVKVEQAELVHLREFLANAGT